MTNYIIRKDNDFYMIRLENVTSWVNWTQPVFTSYNTWGVTSASSVDSSNSHYLTHALDNNTSTYWSTSSGNTGWYQWLFAQNLKLQALSIFANSSGDPSTIQIYGINDDDSKTLITTITTNISDFVTATLDNNVYKGIYLDINRPGASNRAIIREMKLTAQIHQTPYKIFGVRT